MCCACLADQLSGSTHQMVYVQVVRACLLLLFEADPNKLVGHGSISTAAQMQPDLC